MPTYHVVWEIDVDAENEIEAAQMALKIQRDPDSEALFFDVKNRDDGREIYEPVDLNMHEIPDDGDELESLNDDSFNGSLTPEDRDELYEIAIEDEYNNGEL